LIHPALNKIALIAGGATISIVEDYDIVNKFEVEIPNEFSGIIKCSNPKCITNSNERVKSRFVTVSKKPLILKCHYCEREMEGEEIEENII